MFASFTTAYRKRYQSVKGMLYRRIACHGIIWKTHLRACANHKAAIHEWNRIILVFDEMLLTVAVVSWSWAVSSSSVYFSAMLTLFIINSWWTKLFQNFHWKNITKPSYQVKVWEAFWMATCHSECAKQLLTKLVKCDQVWKEVYIPKTTVNNLHCLVLL